MVATQRRLRDRRPARALDRPPRDMAVKLDYGSRPLTVDVAIAADGSLDPDALQRQLQAAAQQATVPFRRSCDAQLGGCDCANGTALAERARPRRK